MIISFAGHSFIYASDKVKELVKEHIRKNIIDSKHIACYLGGYGDFDEICARACRELKQEYAGIELVYVTAYLGLREQAKIKEMHKHGLYDTSIYPPIENAPRRIAPRKVINTPICAAAPRRILLGFEIRGAKSVIQPIPRKIRGG